MDSVKSFVTSEFTNPSGDIVFRLSGWLDGKPWHSWRELEQARFAPGKPLEEGRKDGISLIDSDPKVPASQMLLIKVLRGEPVELAKNKRMPLNGPYLTDQQIDRLVELITQHYKKPPCK